MVSLLEVSVRMDLTEIELHAKVAFISPRAVIARVTRVAVCVRSTLCYGHACGPRKYHYTQCPAMVSKKSRPCGTFIVRASVAIERSSDENSFWRE